MAERVEMQARVEQRQKELAQALTVTEAQGHDGERLKMLKGQLDVATNALQGGWDKVSEVGAEALSQWLEATQALIIPQEAEPAKA